MIAAVIPTRFHPPELEVLITQLEADGVAAFVMESALYDHHIYRMWNAGVALARATGVTEIAVLNDDIAILPGTLPRLAELLRSDPKVGVVYPDVGTPTWVGLADDRALTPTVGTWGSGGMTGFAFMFRANLGIPFDESFGLWYGDDAFEAAVRSAGLLVCRAEGVPIYHRPGGSTNPDEWGTVIAADRERWDWWQGVQRHYALDNLMRTE